MSGQIDRSTYVYSTSTSVHMYVRTDVSRQIREARRIHLHALRRCMSYTSELDILVDCSCHTQHNSLLGGRFVGTAASHAGGIVRCGDAFLQYGKGIVCLYIPHPVLYKSGLLYVSHAPLIAGRTRRRFRRKRYLNRYRPKGLRQYHSGSHKMT
jgi:hypothetical protein